jgi:hypothetical protein
MEMAPEELTARPAAATRIADSVMVLAVVFGGGPLAAARFQRDLIAEFGETYREVPRTGADADTLATAGEGGALKWTVAS